MSGRQNRKRSYKSCFFKECETTISTPSKFFISVPKGEERVNWIKIVRPNENFSLQTRLYCCEDHFNVSFNKFF